MSLPLANSVTVNSMTDELLTSTKETEIVVPNLENSQPVRLTPSAPPSDSNSTAPVKFLPIEPLTLEETGLTDNDMQALILKFLLNHNTATGRAISDQVQLPRPLITVAMGLLRAELLVAIKGSAGVDDYLYHLTEAGHDLARRLARECTYSGVAPVPLESYVDAMQCQSLQQSRLTIDDLRSTFSELRLDPVLLSQLGQAINDGRGLFLYGSPGNGKTSVSELVVSAFGEFVWIPHTITIDGDLIRLYDPRSHKAVDAPQLKRVKYDRRWILIHRPTIVVGGELAMEQLDLQTNSMTGICEAPVQLRANCGALVIDDFGRQRMPTSEILNRLIVPMEKHHDYLNLPSGRQLAVPFDMLLVFSTNLEPSDLVDEAFLRRIPYKIEVLGPDEKEFVSLFVELAGRLGFECSEDAVVYLLDNHYRESDRPMRYCHPRDLLRQIRNFCEFHDRPREVNRETLDVAVRNYFAGL